MPAGGNEIPNTMQGIYVSSVSMYLGIEQCSSTLPRTVHGGNRMLSSSRRDETQQQAR